MEAKNKEIINFNQNTKKIAEETQKISTENQKIIVENQNLLLEISQVNQENENLKKKIVDLSNNLKIFQEKSKNHENLISKMKNELNLNLDIKKENEIINKKNDEINKSLQSFQEIISKLLQKDKENEIKMANYIEMNRTLTNKNLMNETEIYNLQKKNQEEIAKLWKGKELIIENLKTENQNHLNERKEKEKEINILNNQNSLISQKIIKIEQEKIREINLLKTNSLEKEEEIKILTNLFKEKTTEIEILTAKISQKSDEKFAEETRREHEKFQNLNTNSNVFSNESLFELMERNLVNFWKFIEIMQEFFLAFKVLIMENDKESKFIGEIKKIYEGFFGILQSKNEEFKEKVKICKEMMSFRTEKQNLKEEFLKNFHYGDDLVEKIHGKKG